MIWSGLVFELLDDFLYVAAGALVYSYKDIVHRMNQITHIERLPGQVGLPDLLDIKRSSAP